MNVQLQIGKRLPKWKLEDVSKDKAPDFEDFIGKAFLILFFNLGCPGCKGRAIPYANRLVLEHGEKLNVIGIHSNFENVDFTDEQFETAREEFFIRFPFYRDFNYDSTFINYEAGGTPHWILADDKGNLVYSIFGSDPNNALLRLDLKLKELLP